MIAAILAAVSITDVTVAANPLPPEDESWIEVRTRHFTVFGNASREAIEKAGLALEGLRAALARLQPDKKLNSPRPTLIYVFRDAESFAPFQYRQDAGSAELTGQFVTDDDRNFISLA